MEILLSMHLCFRMIFPREFSAHSLWGLSDSILGTLQCLNGCQLVCFLKRRFIFDVWWLAECCDISSFASPCFFPAALFDHAVYRHFFIKLKYCFNRNFPRGSTVPQFSAANTRWILISFTNQTADEQRAWFARRRNGADFVSRLMPRLALFGPLMQRRHAGRMNMIATCPE